MLHLISRGFRCFPLFLLLAFLCPSLAQSYSFPTESQDLRKDMFDVYIAIDSYYFNHGSLPTPSPGALLPSDNLEVAGDASDPFKDGFEHRYVVSYFKLYAFVLLLLYSSAVFLACRFAKSPRVAFSYVTAVGVAIVLLSPLLTVPRYIGGPAPYERVRYRQFIPAVAHEDDRLFYWRGRSDFGVIQSVGPDGVRSLILEDHDPDAVEVESLLRLSTYDPTNGIQSEGDIFLLFDDQTYKEMSDFGALRWNGI